MDKQFIKEQGLEDFIRRFNQINEYTFITKPVLNEEGEDDEQQPQDANQNMQAPQGQQDFDMGAMQPQMGQQQPQDASMPQAGGMMQQAGNMQMPQADDMGMMPQGQDGQIEDIPMDDGLTEPMQPEDEVINVDDLTNAQDETNFEISNMSQKLDRLMQVINNFSDALEQNDQQIQALSQEFQKRNPTETEKLNIRSQAASPFSENPRDFWDQTAANNPHYDVMFNNATPTADEQREFEIRQSDVNNFNEKVVEDSFDDLFKKHDISDFLQF